MTRLRTTEPYGTFRVTFEAITEESAATGDVADRGYVDVWGDPVDEPAASEWSFRDLVGRFSHAGQCAGDGSRVPRWITVTASDSEIGRTWWKTVKGERASDLNWWRDLGGDDAIGVSCSVHRPDWITDASWLRVCRVIGWAWHY